MVTPYAILAARDGWKVMRDKDWQVAYFSNSDTRSAQAYAEDYAAWSNRQWAARTLPEERLPK